MFASPTRPRRNFYATPLGRVVGVFFGLLLMTGGGFATFHGAHTAWTLLTDRSCLSTVGMSTPPSDGPNCRVLTGTIVRRYTQFRRRSADHYYVEFRPDADASGTQALDRQVDLGSHADAIYTSTYDDRAVLETVNGNPYSIATAAGAEGPLDNPLVAVLIGLFLVLAGVLLAFFGLAGRLGSRRRS